MVQSPLWHPARKRIWSIVTTSLNPLEAFTVSFRHGRRLPVHGWLQPVCPLTLCRQHGTQADKQSRYELLYCRLLQIITLRRMHEMQPIAVDVRRVWTVWCEHSWRNIVLDGEEGIRCSLRQTTLACCYILLNSSQGPAKLTEIDFFFAARTLRHVKNRENGSYSYGSQAVTITSVRRTSVCCITTATRKAYIEGLL